MKVAIVGRLEDYEEDYPFNKRYTIDYPFREMFDVLNILIIPILSRINIEEIESMCDALILPGSATGVDPKYYNDVPFPGKEYKYDEYKLDKEVIDLFVKAKKPILGICGGMQTLNVYFGGDLNQNVLNHKLEDNSKHKAKIMQDSFLYSVYQKEDIEINSFHRQAVRKLANNFKVTATSEDGIIEAIEYGNIIGVQWHPEALKDIEFFDKFFKTFVK